MYKHTPSADLFASEEAYLLTLDVPGVSGDDIDLTVEGRSLTVSAGGGEDSTPRWWRRFTLPREVDADNITADHRDGVLSPTLPRGAGTGSRRIVVSAG